jgi:hypothetical protein
MYKILYSTTNTIPIILIHSNRESRFVNVSEWSTLFQFLDYGDQALVSAEQFSRLFFSIVSKQKRKARTGIYAYLLTINAWQTAFLSAARRKGLSHTSPSLLHAMELEIPIYPL